MGEKKKRDSQKIREFEGDDENMLQNNSFCAHIYKIDDYVEENMHKQSP